MQWVTCDFCGQDNAEKIAEQTDLLHQTTDERFSVVRCKNCGLHYTNPRPTPAEIGRYYGQHYSFHAASSWWRKPVEMLLDRIAMSPLACILAAVPPVARRLAARIRPLIDDPVLSHIDEGSCDSFLDIGCGSGMHAHFWGYGSSLRSCARRVKAAGVEISDAARQALARENIESWPSLKEVPPNRRFSLIRMNWSLEHVHSPNEYFAFIGSHLSANGRAVITVPHHDGLIYRVAPDCLELPIHLYHFRLQDMQAYCARHGLRIIRSQTFSYPGMFAQAARAGLLPDSFRAAENLITAQKMQRILQMFDAAGMGNDLLLVLEKNDGA